MKKAVLLTGLMSVMMPAMISAQSLAVPGVSPSNPLAILTVPETSIAMKGIEGSAFGRAMLARHAAFWASPQNAAARDQFAATSQTLGIDLTPPRFLVDQVKGFDLYVVEIDSFQNYVLALQMRDPAVADKVLGHITQEAAGASGVSGGFRADTVVERTVTKGRTIYLPAFEMYFADLEGGILVYSTNQKALESALSDDGRAMFTSAYFDRFSKGLPKNETAPWMLGELDRLSPIISSVTGLPDFVTAQILPPSGATQLAAGVDRLEITTFIPQTELKGEPRRYALAAPPASRVAFSDMVPANPLVGYATAHFDGIAFLDAALAMIDSLPGRAGTGEKVNKGLEESRGELGFDPRTDLLATLGPDMAIYLSEFTPAEDPTGMPKAFSGVFVAGVRDEARFTRIVKLLEERLSPPPPTPKSKDEPAPTPVNPIQTEQFQGIAIRSVASPPVSWALTSDRFYVGTSTVAIKEAIDVAADPAKAQTSTDSWKVASAVQDASRTSVLGASGSRFASLFPTLPAEWQAVLTAAEYVSVSTTYRTEGKKQQLVVLTAPAK